MPGPATSACLPPPSHIAIIMDGNGRWATARGLPRTAGHKKGVDAVRHAIEGARELGVRYLTLYSFSTENWSRPEDEVFTLMQLLRFYLRGEIAKLHKNGIQLRVIGDRSRLSADIQALIANAETLTAENTDMTLVLALSYGGRQELVDAARKLAQAVERGELNPDAITTDVFARELSTGGTIPDPDLMIRTSGEKRISNFLLWQLAYAEMVFLDTLWPDFTRRDLEAAIQEYHRRDRRFGATVGSR
ncbi:di-trans,poly-cis-decaprenylcistransferase [Niveispirillum lacus]|uniref:Isoprenyl transferase n=1 Tax=Niveispirillum lacus TaxID=1981099 RepID=A0A255YW69_9PROT|nr:isoprenyl transferase [Niveispirillum lacus]OYQ33483.1 di-trans,poly-cis-decaprenylcistransferase [Niveispirillum lacus]